MAVSVSNLAVSFYTVILKKLRWLRERHRQDDRAGEFWARARQKVTGTGWVKSHAKWFEGQSTVMPVAMEFNKSRFMAPAVISESFAPPQIGAINLAQSVEVA